MLLTFRDCKISGFAECHRNSCFTYYLIFLDGTRMPSESKTCIWVRIFQNFAGFCNGLNL